MRTILFIIQKEVLQIVRNRAMLPMIFVVPIIQLCILVNVATFEMKNIKLFVIDRDLTPTSRQLISKLEGSPFFHIIKHSFSDEEGKEAIRNGKADAVIEIPYYFEKDLVNSGSSKVQLNINAINAMVAGLTNAYTSSVINDYNNQLLNIITPSLRLPAYSLLL